MVRVDFCHRVFKNNSMEVLGCWFQGTCAYGKVGSDQRNAEKVTGVDHGSEKLERFGLLQLLFSDESRFPLLSDTPAHIWRQTEESMSPD